jgi:exopolysaccharide production protein ExoZ
MAADSQNAPSPQPRQGAILGFVASINVTYYRGLQYLRGVAALCVVAYHAGGKSNFDFHVGQAGVDVFFVLSGFLIASISEKATNPRAFLIARMSRIVPLYWIATSVVIIGAAAQFFPSINLTAGHVVCSFAFVPCISPSNGHLWPLLVPGWSLNYEFFFYLTFTCAILLPRQFRVPAIVMFFSGLLIAGWAMPAKSDTLDFYSNPIIIEFLIGIVIAKLARHMISRLGGHLLIATAVVTLAAECVVAAHDLTEKTRLIFWGFPAALLLTGIISVEKSRSLPKVPVLLLLGDASYSIYIWHTLAISLGAKLLILLDCPELLLFPALIAFGTATGSVLYLFVERPIIVYFAVRSRRAKLKNDSLVRTSA